VTDRYLVGTQVVEGPAGGAAHALPDGSLRVETSAGAVAAQVWGEEVCIAGRTRRVRRAPPAAALPPPIVTPPMPAVVARVLVAVGDVVTAGQPLVTVSAMKMELTLRSPRDGTVSDVRVAVGDRVSPGQVLVEVTP
jgi:3-methylcrotonyl-CoA carboxylase alpha subunit